MYGNISFYCEDIELTGEETPMQLSSLPCLFVELQTQVDEAIGELGRFFLQNPLEDHDLGERVPQEKFMELLDLSLF